MVFFPFLDVGSKVAPLREYFSEFGLIKNRVIVVMAAMVVAAIVEIVAVGVVGSLHQKYPRKSMR
jgi:hypothetical protein